MLLKMAFAVALILLSVLDAPAGAAPARITQATTVCANARALLALNSASEARRTDPEWVHTTVVDGQCGRLQAGALVTSQATADGLTQVEFPRGSGRLTWALSSVVAASSEPAPNPVPAAAATPAPAAAPAPANWTATDAAAGPSGACELSGRVGEGSLSMVASPDQPGAVGLVLRDPSWHFASGTKMLVRAYFADRAFFALPGTGANAAVETRLTDRLSSWIRELTTARGLTLASQGIAEKPWTIQLAGIGPAVAAFAKCIQANPAINVPPPFARTPVAPAIAAAQPTPSPPAPAVTPSDPVLANWSGAGMMTTRPFRVDGPWELRWTSGAGPFSVDLHEVGTGREKLVANQTLSGSSSAYRPNGGVFYLEITGSSPWTLQAVRVLDDLSGTPSSPSVPQPATSAPAATRSDAAVPVPTPTLAPAPTSAPAPTPPPAPNPVAARREPPDVERQFTSIINKYADVYKSGEDEMFKAAVRPARGNELCKLLPRRNVANWTGEVIKLAANHDAKGSVEVKIGKDIYVTTWNNELSDADDHTMIGENTALFKNLTSLAEGKTVRFSGEFLPSDVDCLLDKSVTVNGSMTEPEYIFRFTAIDAAE